MSSNFVGRFSETPSVLTASDPDALKPRETVKRDEERRDASGIEHFHGDEKSREVRQDGDQERDQRDDAETAGVTMFGVVLVKRVQIQVSASKHEIIGDHDSTDRPEQRAVAYQPSEDVAGRIRHE